MTLIYIIYNIYIYIILLFCFGSTINQNYIKCILKRVRKYNIITNTIFKYESLYKYWLLIIWIIIELNSYNNLVTREIITYWNYTFCHVHIMYSVTATELNVDNQFWLTVVISQNFLNFPMGFTVNSYIWYTFTTRVDIAMVRIFSVKLLICTRVCYDHHQIHLKVHNGCSSLVCVPDFHLYWNCEVWWCSTWRWNYLCEYNWYW